MATPLATLARNLVEATPTVMGRPTWSRTSRRSRRAMSTVPAVAQPLDVEEGLSIDSASTSGVVCSNTSNTAALASV